MPNIDTSTISGFDGMTAEQKVEALLKLEIPEAVDMSGYIKKSVFDAKAKEAAELSKKLKGKLTDDELAEAERQKAQEESEKKYADLEGKYNELVKKSTIAEYTAKYIALGYDKDLAADTAKAMADGDMEKVFANGEKHRVAMEKKMKEELLKGTPRPDGSGGNDGGNEKDPSVAQAEKIGKAKSAANQVTADVMKHYIK